MIEEYLTPFPTQCVAITDKLLQKWSLMEYFIFFWVLKSALLTVPTYSSWYVATAAWNRPCIAIIKTARISNVVSLTSSDYFDHLCLWLWLCRTKFGLNSAFFVGSRSTEFISPDVWWCTAVKRETCHSQFVRRLGKKEKGNFRAGKLLRLIRIDEVWALVFGYSL